LIVIALAGVFLMKPLSPSASAAATTYYVDCTAGNDNNAGTSASTAWKSVSRANQATLNPGDQLLLKRGCTWAQQLKAKWNGTASQPIVIGAYGSGALPKLQNNQDGNVRITGSYQTIENLQTYNSPSSYGQILSSCNNQPVGWVIGFNFAGGSNNTLQNSLATHAAMGVSLTGSANNNRILHNQFINNDGAWELPSSSQGIRGGTGIGLTGTGNVIAYNHFEGNTTLCNNESVSIELYTASNSNIHHNTAYGDANFVETGSTSSFQSSDNTIAYNVHTTGVAHSRFVVTRGQGDAYGPVWRTNVFNNVVYYTGSDSAGVVCSNCGTNILRMQNNIIDVVTKAFYVGPGQGAIESNNIFWSPSGQVPQWNFVQNWTMSSTSRIANPMFANPGGKDFRLQSTSPAINAGTTASVNAGYTTDLAGNTVPQGGAVDIGAYETGSTATSPSSSSTNAPNLPRRIQAENYRSGGEGVGYHDTTPANLGGAYRNDGVDIQKCTDSTTAAGETCYNVGWPDAGEWLSYNVNVPTAGTFHVGARVASVYSGMKFHVEVDGKNVTGSMTVPNTNGWQNWTTVTSGTFSLSAGEHTLKFVAETAGFNVNYFDVTN
jgi:parallel beta-helix repeat protein